MLLIRRRLYFLPYAAPCDWGQQKLSHNHTVLLVVSVSLSHVIPAYGKFASSPCHQRADAREFITYPPMGGEAGF